MKSFNEWYKEANKTKDDGFTNRDFYKAGQQSKQQEVDELQKRIDGALNVMCKLQYSSGERIYDEVGKILKGDNHES